MSDDRAKERNKMERMVMKENRRMESKDRKMIKNKLDKVKEGKK
jgi:hypothetical protein